MAVTACIKCPIVQVHTVDLGLSSKQSFSIQATSLTLAPIGAAKLTVILAQANSLRKCADCRHHLTDICELPAFWWTDWAKRSNGYVGCNESIKTDGTLNSYTTWFRFLIKQTLRTGLFGVKDYIWHKFNIFTHWRAADHNTTILILEPGKVDIHTLVDALMETAQKLPTGHGDPYWAHSAILQEILRLQDAAVWAIRDLVREMEENRTSALAPNPDYPRLHDNARHAIHVNETTNVGLRVLSDMSALHQQFMLDYDDNTDRKTKAQRRQIQKQFCFFQSALHGLYYRSTSNAERFQNELQLAFNTVAQYDSLVAVEISKVAQYDSFAMKVVAFVTLLFLPATFIAALFSMSFFNYDAEKGWTMSEDIWLYGAIAGPITAAALIFGGYCYWWIPPESVRKIRIRPRGEEMVGKQRPQAKEISRTPTDTLCV